ncbi:unnamed protein product [Porites lobata]|uniref:Uncharacterized protein n=1 Tax=Porites lobata TaxID=104759 RepID=A0ABN8RRG4_9CNID|nr:unnamed protein product [Porites lobata]
MTQWLGQSALILTRSLIWKKNPKGKTAVTLFNVRSSIKDEVESVVIQNNTKMQPVVLPFSYKDISMMSSLPSLASLQDVSLEQLVEVKAKLTRLTAVKTQNNRFGQTLQKQEAILVDHTTSIKVILWQEHCNTLTEEKTYRLRNLRIKESYGTRYLNTPKSEHFEFEEIPAFTQTLAAMSAKIIGVQTATKSLSCVACKKKVTIKTSGQIANCQSCKLMQKVNACSPQWILKILFQNTNNISEKVAIMLFHQEVTKLATLSSDINLNLISEEELILTLLEMDSEFLITYNTSSNKLIDVSQINI